MAFRSVVLLGIPPKPARSLFKAKSWRMFINSNLVVRWQSKSQLEMKLLCGIEGAKEPAMMYFPTEWGTKEPHYIHHPQNFRVGNVMFFCLHPSNYYLCPIKPARMREHSVQHRQRRWWKVREAKRWWPCGETMVMSKGVLRTNKCENRFFHNQPLKQPNTYKKSTSDTRYLPTRRPITSLGLEQLGDHTSTVSRIAWSTHWEFQWLWAISRFEWYLTSWVSLASNFERSWPLASAMTCFITRLGSYPQLFWDSTYSEKW